MSPDDPAHAVLVSQQHLPEAWLVEVMRACEQAGATYVPWGADASSSLGHNASLLVSGIAAGEREIPEDALEFMTRSNPGVPLLLLCAERLKRRSVSLQNGRVLLIGPPLDAEFIHSRMRILLAERGRRVEATSTSGELVRTCEYQRPDWWVAAIDCAGDAAQAAPGGPPRLYQSTVDGLTAFLPAMREQAAGRVDDVAAIMRRAEPDAQKDASLKQLLGNDVAVVHLSPDAKQWLFYWPDVSWPLTVHSETRLPQSYNLASSVAGTELALLRISAAPGDVVAGFTTPLLTPVGRGLSAAAALGGPVLLAVLKDTLAARPAPFKGLLAEVR